MIIKRTGTSTSPHYSVNKISFDNNFTSSIIFVSVPTEQYRTQTNPIYLRGRMKGWDSRIKSNFISAVKIIETRIDGKSWFPPPQTSYCNLHYPLTLDAQSRLAGFTFEHENPAILLDMRQYFRERYHEFWNADRVLAVMVVRHRCSKSGKKNVSPPRHERYQRSREQSYQRKWNSKLRTCIMRVGRPPLMRASCGSKQFNEARQFMRISWSK